MFRRVVFKEDFRSFSKGDEFELDDRMIVLLVGDQGSGKSTFIELMRSLCASDQQRERHWRSIGIDVAEARRVILFDCDPGLLFLSYDFERDSGRSTTEMQVDLARQLFDMKSSHGEASLHFLRSIQATLRAKVEQTGRLPFNAIILDEPDANMSPRSCYELVRIFRDLATAGVQVIASVHNPILITGAIPGDPTVGWGGVLSIEHKRWMSPEEFLQLQTQPRRSADGKPT